MMNDNNQTKPCKPKLTKKVTRQPICTISTKTAALILGVSRQHVLQLVKRQRLTCLQDLRPRRFSVAVFSQETGIPVSMITQAAEAIKCQE